ncbi:unnamed protein product [Coccothraustes coccothraustes]
MRRPDGAGGRRSGGRHSMGGKATTKLFPNIVVEGVGRERPGCGCRWDASVANCLLHPCEVFAPKFDEGDPCSCAACTQL